VTALSDPIRYLEGVGPEMARRLDRLGIRTVKDLLFHIPVGYRDRREVTPIAKVTPGTEASIEATVVSVRPLHRARGRRDLEAALQDESGILRAVWFHQPYLASTLKVGERYVFSGAVHAFRGPELHNPEFEAAEGEGNHLHVARIAPRYALTEGITERWLRARVRAALDRLQPPPEVLSGEWRARLTLPPLPVAFERIHFPEDVAEVHHARRRLALEEILALQVALQLARRRHLEAHSAPSLQAGCQAMRCYLEALPFPLTGAQDRALGAIADDLDREVPMRRLLLGDVGSGKTVLAMAAAVRAAGAGHQAALLAPTMLLAEQHAATAAKQLEAAGVSWCLLTAATPERERRRIQEGLSSGEISIAIGTHALLEAKVSFRSLSFVAVDEQHRFGVRQRISLARGADSTRSAHLLVLTATPIPRSYAMTLYGDLDLSILDEKPPGRLPVETTSIDGTRREALVDLLLGEMARGGSAFVVYPIIEESESLDLEDATTTAAALKENPALAAAGIELVHGRLPADERRLALERFRNGAARILVTTTVVEVGLDIPDATLVAIEHPERFGLAQLHQLRGRVGRAGRAGRCVLVTSRGLGEAARQRLRVFQSVSDGFRLAEEDLKQRGPGEFLGTQQHGFPAFRAADPMQDQDLIEASQVLGRELLDRGLAESAGGRVEAWIETHIPGAERFLASG
jgi:ATP-dependent DNA helicase RecG